MNKTFSMSIRVSEEELQKLKQAARIESYASYSEFIRRTALKEADRVIKDSEKGECKDMEKGSCRHHKCGQFKDRYDG